MRASGGHVKKNCLAVLLCVFAAAGLSAQSENLNAMSLTGITGLYVVPTARLGWEGMGFNGGYHMHFVDDDLEDLFQFNMSFFDLFEAAATYVGQAYDDDDDLIAGVKLRLPISSTPIALGGFVVYNDLGRDDPKNHLAAQIYGVFTYQAEFFGMPADTTLVLGKTFVEDRKINSDIDFGMGFDLVVLPKYLGGFLHWLVDFSNYGNIARMSPQRGSVNTGFRIDLSQIPALQNLSFAIDAYLTDAFDAGERNFGIGATFGVQL
jgi:hypothetical protein